MGRDKENGLNCVSYRFILDQPSIGMMFICFNGPQNGVSLGCFIAVGLQCKTNRTMASIDCIPSFS